MMKGYGSIVIKVSIVSILAVLTGCQSSQREKKNISRNVKSVAMRVSDRNFPSVFQAWNPADNIDEDPFVTLARHDLIFHSAQGFKLVWNNIHTGLADGFTSESLNEGLLFMECYGSNNPDNWEKIRTTLLWAEANLRTPGINCLETWFDASRSDFYKMRATTTLTLTHSDGYCLFSDPNSLPVPDHLHNWYTFWDTPLGKPSGQGFERADGSYQREYEGGTVIYNPVGNNPVSIKFSIGMKSMATGLTSEEHSINTYDGDIFILPDK